MHEDFDRCYLAVQSQDARFDGWFITAVASTGIYCRPSCPAVTPKRHNVRFFPSAAAAQSAGFRACKRCRPDATPGSPEWNARADLVGRAMRLIADGVVDRDGVGGLAARLGYSERQVHRQLTAEVGAGPLSLARAQRAQTARVLIESTTLPMAQVAFAAGFASIRQFNDVVRAVFATTPTALRRRAKEGEGRGAVDALTLRLAYREPCDVADALAFLTARAVPGVEQSVDGSYRCSLRLPHGAAVAELSPGAGHVRCRLYLDDLRDLTAAVQRCRRLLDLDADPAAVDERLRADALIGRFARAVPGRRVPGAVDGDELAVRAVLGQQVSLSSARAAAGRLVGDHGKPLTTPRGGVTHQFPTAEALAASDPAAFAMPAARGRALGELVRHLADGSLVIDPGTDRADLRAALLRIPGIGPWTADYVGMRALGDPDAFLPTDAGVRRAVRQLGQAADPAGVTALAEGWRPWRAYATRHLWASLGAAAPCAPARSTGRVAYRPVKV